MNGGQPHPTKHIHVQPICCKFCVYVFFSFRLALFRSVFTANTDPTYFILSSSSSSPSASTMLCVFFSFSFYFSWYYLLVWLNSEECLCFSSISISLASAILRSFSFHVNPNHSICVHVILNLELFSECLCPDAGTITHSFFLPLIFSFSLCTCVCVCSSLECFSIAFHCTEQLFWIFCCCCYLPIRYRKCLLHVLCRFWNLNFSK